MSWRWPLALPAQRTGPSERLRVLAGNTIAALWAVACSAGIACGAEVWRYVMLLRSRTGAVTRTAMVISDSLVATAGMVTWVVGLGAAALSVLWLLRARANAAELTNTRPARSDWQVIVGVLVPGLNLFWPGSALAELEHAVLRGRADAQGDTDSTGDPGAVRPRPSWLVLLWWAAWVASLVLGWLALLWGLRGTVQAMADGVVLHAWSNAVVAVLAALTARVVRDFTTLLLPADPRELRHYRVLGVRGAPTPRRAPRPSTARR